jgi:hypothetical protein
MNGQTVVVRFEETLFHAVKKPVQHLGGVDPGEQDDVGVRNCCMKASDSVNTSEAIVSKELLAIRERSTWISTVKRREENKILATWYLAAGLPTMRTS